MLGIKDILCEGANEVNEDIIWYGNNFVIVLDGSTGLRKKSLEDGANIARWYVTRFKDAIDSYINESITLCKIVTKCMERVEKEFKKVHSAKVDKVDLPSASVTIIRIHNNKLELFSLGDCTTVIKSKEGKIVTVYDDTVTRLDNKVIEEMIAIREKKGIDIVAAREEVNNLLIENRYKKNTREGYWILGFDKEAVNHAFYNEFDLEKIDKVYMMSDGMAEYYENLKLVYSIDEFINEVDKEGAEFLYKQMRQIQEDDKLCNKYPRIKPKDDVSLVICKF